MFIEMLWLIFASFLSGIIVGLIIKGIHIHINQRPPEPPGEFNEIDEESVPPQYRQFIEKTKGFID